MSSHHSRKPVAPRHTEPPCPRRSMRMRLHDPLSEVSATNSHSAWSCSRRHTRGRGRRADSTGASVGRRSKRRRALPRRARLRALLATPARGSAGARRTPLPRSCSHLNLRRAQRQTINHAIFEYGNPCATCPIFNALRRSASCVRKTFCASLAPMRVAVKFPFLLAVLTDVHSPSSRSLYACASRSSGNFAHRRAATAARASHKRSRFPCSRAR